MILLVVTREARGSSGWQPKIQKTKNHYQYQSSPRPPESLYSLSGRTFYRQISRSLKSARLEVIIIASLWNLMVISAVLLCRGEYQILKQFEKLKPESRGFESPRDLATRRPSAKWEEALGFTTSGHDLLFPRIIIIISVSPVGYFQQNNLSFVNYIQNYGWHDCVFVPPFINIYIFGGSTMPSRKHLQFNVKHRM